MKLDLDIQFFAGKYVGPEALTELVSKTKEYVNDGLSNKVDKVTGKGLSTEDYTTSEKNKLANVESGAQANVQSDWNATSGDAKILNKPTLATVATSGSYDDLSNKPTIPTVNDATFTVKVEGTSKGTFTANQSSNAEVNITASDLGLSSAMKFIGTTTTQISDGSTTNPITINGSSVTALSGNVVLYDNREYLWNGSLSTPAWEELGDESSHALKTVTITGTGALGGGGSLEANRTITHNAGTAASQSSGLYKFSTDAYSHVASVTAVTKSDITALGIPGEDTNTWRPLGTGANDACAGNDSRLSDSRPASDVYSWAKASTKPSYSYSEISGTPSLATVATSGSYNDLSDKPTIPDISGKLDKTTYEWNKEIAFGQYGYLLIGKFPMYDSNITVYIDSTTSNTYHGVLVLATQNINTSHGGTASAVVYGDSSNTVAPSLKIKYSNGSNVFELYFAPQSWSKNLIHIKAVALAGNPTNICETVDSVPSSDLISVTNALTTNFYSSSNPSGYITSSGSCSYATSAGSAPASDVYSWAKASSKPSYSWSEISSKPSFATVATSGSYNDLSNKPTIPTNNNQLTNGAGYITSSDSCSYATSAGSAPANGGNADSSLYVRGSDTRSVNPNPSDYFSSSYKGYIRTDFKQANTIGYASSADYGQQITITPWTDYSGGYPVQLFVSSPLSSAGIRFATSGSSWGDWQTLITSGNIGSQSVNYATSAGSANSVSWSNVSGRPTAVSSFTNDSGYITSSGSCNYATSAGSAPASDVYSWAKASSKPSYNFGEIDKGNITVGYQYYINLRPDHDSYDGGMYYSTPGNEAIVFANKNAVTSWIFATTSVTSRADWTTLTPSMQIKNGRVTINKLIANETNASYNLDVDGSINGTTIYQNGTALATVATSGSYDDLSDKPTIPSSVSQLTNDSGYITSSGSCNYATSAGSAPASDVYAWAKASTKPSYSWSEISSKPSFATVATSGSYDDLSNKPTTSRTLYIYAFTIKCSDSGGNDNVNICAYGVSTTYHSTTDTKGLALSDWVDVFGTSNEVAASGQVRSKWYSSHCDVISVRITSTKVTSGTFYYTHIIPYGSASATASMTSTGSRSVSEIYYIQCRNLGSFTV